MAKINVSSFKTNTKQIVCCYPTVVPKIVAYNCNVSNFHAETEALRNVLVIWLRITRPEIAGYGHSKNIARRTRDVM